MEKKGWNKKPKPGVRAIRQWLDVFDTLTRICLTVGMLVLIGLQVGRELGSHDRIRWRYRRFVQSRQPKLYNWRQMRTLMEGETDARGHHHQHPADPAGTASD